MRNPLFFLLRYFGTYIGCGRVRMANTKQETPVIERVLQVTKRQLGTTSGILKQAEVKLQQKVLEPYT